MPVTTPVLVEQFLFGAKTETSYGSLASLSASDFMYVDKCEVKFESEDIPREALHANLNALESVQGPVLISFAVEGEYYATSGSALGPMDAIELASGMTGSAYGIGGRVYSGSNTAPTSFPGPGQSATLLAYHKGELVAIRGSYGDYEETHESNGTVKFKFTGKGLYSTWSTQTQPAPTFTTASYIRVSSSSLSVHSYIPEWSKLTFKYGNTVEAIPYSGDVNGYSRVIITKRRPTFEFDPLLPGQATHDYIARLVAKTKGALSYTVGGGVATHQARLAYSASETQYTVVDVADRNGVQSFNVTGKIIGAFTKTLSGDPPA